MRAATSFLLLIASLLSAQECIDVSIDVSAYPTVTRADFRCWAPRQKRPLQAVLVLLPGANGDGRSLAADPAWRAFAVTNQLMLVTGCLQSRVPRRPFYDEVTHGGGAALDAALVTLCGRLKQPELARGTLYFWGHSAGGQFGVNYAAWKPSRVGAVVSTKGGIFINKAGPDHRSVPILFFSGSLDEPRRRVAIERYVESQRMLGARWAWCEEPDRGHEVGGTLRLARAFLGEAIQKEIAWKYLRLDDHAEIEAAAEADRLNPEVIVLPGLRSIAEWRRIRVGTKKAEASQ